jgi:hypothetical protein
VLILFRYLPLNINCIDLFVKGSSFATSSIDWRQLAISKDIMRIYNGTFYMNTFGRIITIDLWEEFH